MEQEIRIRLYADTRTAQLEIGKASVAFDGLQRAVSGAKGALDGLAGKNGAYLAEQQAIMDRVVGAVASADRLRAEWTATHDRATVAAINQADAVDGIGVAFDRVARRSARAAAEMVVGLGAANRSVWNLVQTLASGVIEREIERRITGPLSQLAEAGLGWALNGIGALFGGGGGASFEGATSVSTSSVLHAGGIAGSEGGMRILPASAFWGAPRFHSGGVAGDEVPAVLRRGEGVFTPGQMAALGGGVSVQIIDQRGAGAPPVQVSQGRGPDGRMLVTAIIKREVGELADSGALDSTLGRNYGVARQPVRRS